MIPIIKIIFSWLNLNAPNLEPKNPPRMTTKVRGKISAKSTSLVIEWAANPLTEFVSMNKLAEAAAVFGLARPVIIKIGDNQMPPPIPTRPETVPKRLPSGNVIRDNREKLKFNFRIFSCLIFICFPLSSNIAEAEKSEITNINMRSFSGSTVVPAMNANGTEISNGIEIRIDKWPALK